MATPKTVTDDSSHLDEAVLNLFLRAGKVEVKLNYFGLLFTAATNAVTVAGDSDGEVVDGDLVWNAGNTWIDVTLSGFTALACGLVSIRENAATNVAAVRMYPNGNNAQIIGFLAAGAGPPALVDPDDDITLSVIVIGV